MKLSPYQRIMRASAMGKGVRLSPDDVFLITAMEPVADIAERSRGDCSDQGIDGALLHTTGQIRLTPTPSQGTTDDK